MLKFMAFSLSAFIFSPCVGYTCTRSPDYRPITMPEAFASAGLVFEGEVLDNRPHRNWGIQDPWFRKVTFRIHRIWKGDIQAGKTISIRLNQSNCDEMGAIAEVGTRFIVFTSPDYLSKKSIFGSVDLISGFEYGSFELTSFRFPNTKERDAKQIALVDEVANRHLAQPGGPADAHTGEIRPRERR
jgi:hypothetical protein